jgi:membrane-associated phospholipid phosphatase
VSWASRTLRFESWLSDGEGRLRKRRFAIVLAGFYLLFGVTYLAINEFSAGRSTLTLFLPGEAGLPFVPAFAYLYVLVYWVPAVFVVTIPDYSSFRRLARAYALILLIAYTTYLAWPVYFERPGLEVSSCDTWLLSIEYLDKPYNQFPSLHVAWSWLVVHASQVSARSRVGLGLLAAGISASTLFVKEHYVVDVLYGWALAWGAWRLAGFRRS